MSKRSFRKCAICGTASREKNMRVGPMGSLFCGDESSCCERARALMGANETREQIDEEHRWAEAAPTPTDTRNHAGTAPSGAATPP